MSTNRSAPLPRRREALARGLGLGVGTGIGALWPACLRAQAATVVAPAPAPLHRLHTGDLGALVAVDARLGGRPWRALIDSGASVAIVSPAVAARDGLRTIDRRRVATAGGTMELVRVELPALEIAGQRLDAGHALVLDLAAHLGDVGAAVDGLIGVPALRDRVTRLDLAAGMLHWGRSAAAAADTGSLAVWPLGWDQGLPVVELSLGARAPAPFLFDTGNAGAIVVFARHAERLTAGAPALPSVTLQELGGPVTVNHVLIERLAAPGYAAREVPAAFESGRRARRGAHFDRLAGSAGLALFDAGAVTLDGPGGRLLIEQPGLPGPPRLPGGFGLALQSVAGAFPVVASVFDGGPAARAGVRPGHRLQRLDGRELAGIGAGEVWRRLSGVDEAAFAFDRLPAPVVLRRERFFARWH